MATSNKLLKPAEAAEILAVSERTLWTITKSGQLPSIKIGRCVRYELQDIERFIETAKRAG